MTFFIFPHLFQLHRCAKKLKFYLLYKSYSILLLLIGFLFGMVFFKVLPESGEDENLSRRILSRQREILFVGGVPRSGTTLMRALLDVHPDIRCGEETRVIPDLLGTLKNWENPDHKKLLDLAGVSRNVLNDAVSAFISEHGMEAELLCNKDPLTMKHSQRLREMFPNAKFILMIRDGRAVVHSMIKRQVPVGGFNRSDPEQSLSQWNRTISQMYKQCVSLGSEICLMVYYERLILYPREELEKIFNFIQIPFIEEVLQHEKFIGKEIKLSPHEFSTSQVKKKLNKEALKSWVGFYSQDLLEKMTEIAPMLNILGYDTASATPEYDKLPRI